MKKIALIGIVLLAVYFFFIKAKSGPNVSQNGISTHQLADDIRVKYDRNSDGNLDVSGESFLRTETNTTVKVESRGLLFTDADNFGNKDGSVSPIELETYLQEFDLDSDGELTSYKNIIDSLFNGKSEWDEFDSKYGERFKHEEI